ncbi:DUF2326 domain-containing protein [Caldifermentibacillus hisashii]|uniref:DUF2326 domain-containing protein n=1 Tax=Caldifermentibacillus hisashii TaxID=996558 RepID=UPI001C0FC443|nr:DUF2326 domain-containing protein [Caldifermentibacillus hisashii]MBU5344078.1 DUF2326 domain-containing protein [Caldifermentibacillus hisashii]
MQLIKVSANQADFKTVHFNKSGLNFIVAKQKNVENKDTGNTYNGVGKSLLVSIVHFCLGSSKKNYKSFCRNLPDWEFSLEFIIGDTHYTATRSTNNPDRINLNGEKLILRDFNEKLEKLCFQIPDGVSNLSFRALLPFFIRPNKKSYVSFDEASGSHNSYQKMLYNAFLLGLDVFLAHKKYNLKKEQNRIEELERNFRKDDLLRDFFSGQKDVALTIDDLDEQIEKLEVDLKNFKIADDYYQVQLEADEIERKLFQLNNKIILLKNNVASIEKSLSIEPSKDNLDDIQKVYAEVNVHFSDTLTKTLSDLESFYKKLISNRKRRLLEHKNKLGLEIEEKLIESQRLQKNFDELMKYLGDHDALDVFVTLSEKYSNLKAKRDNLKKYQVLQTEYKEKLREIEKNQIEQSETTDEYLRRMQTEIGELRNYFRNLVKRFYPHSVAGLSIENNDRDNLQRYDIDAKIESDNSDGINNVKIFCYDLTLLFKGQNHNMNVIFHDSRLFDGIDERQKAELIKVLYEEFSNTNKQYIATVNQNQLNEIYNILGDELYTQIIEKNTVLVLTDEDPSEKLLGIQVDIEDN